MSTTTWSVLSDSKLEEQKRLWTTFEIPSELWDSADGNNLVLKEARVGDAVVCCAEGKTFSVITEKIETTFVLGVAVGDDALGEVANEENQNRVNNGENVEMADGSRTVSERQQNSSLCVAGETQRILTFRRMRAKFSDADEALARAAEAYESENDQQVTPPPGGLHRPKGLTLPEIVAASRASRCEVTRYLPHAFTICDVSNCTADSIEEARWFTLEHHDILAAMRLTVAQLTANLAAVGGKLSLLEAADSLRTAAESQNFTLACGVELSNAAALQLLRHFATVPGYGRAASIVGAANVKALSDATKYEIFVQQLVDVTLKSHEFSDQLQDPRISLDVILMLRVSQLAVLSQHQSLAYEKFVALSSQILEEVLPAELPAPTEIIVDYESRMLELSINEDAGQCLSARGAFPRDPMGAFDSHFSFCAVKRDLEFRRKHKRRRRPEHSARKHEMTDAAVAFPVTIAGFAYTTGGVANLTPAGLESPDMSEEPLMIHWLPQHLLPWEWQSRLKHMLKLKPRWGEEALDAYLSPSLGETDITLQAIIAGSFVPVTGGVEPFDLMAFRPPPQD